MCNWKNWFWPGLVTTALLTALTGWFLSGSIENDLTLRAGDSLKAGQPWSTIAFDGRDAIVTGIAENEIQQREASTIAAATYGVRTVLNKTELPATADPFTLSMVKDASGVTLRGNYASSNERAALISAAETAMPGIAVKDELTLAAGIPAGFNDLAAFGVSQLANLTAGEVSLSNLDYSLKGDPIDVPTYEALNAQFAAALPASGVLKSAELAIPPLGKPYEFSAGINGDTINLEGYAPSLDAKNAIESTAKTLFSGKNINNLLKLAGGAPEGFAALVDFGLNQLKTLGNGSFSLSGMNYALKGAPVDQSVFDAVTNAAKNSLPAGAAFDASSLIAPPAPQPEPAPAPQPIVVPAAPQISCLVDVATFLSEGQINFRSAVAEIDPVSYPLLDKIAATLNNCSDAKVEISGHTDSEGDDASNQLLSEQRANAVRAYLSNGNATAGRLSAKGYGETQPLVANDTTENKAKNRRIEFRSVE